MQKQILNLIQQVLNEAGEASQFFDLSDAEQLNWMIARAYALGIQDKAKRTPKQKGKSHDRG